MFGICGGAVKITLSNLSLSCALQDTPTAGPDAVDIPQADACAADNSALETRFDANGATDGRTYT